VGSSHRPARHQAAVVWAQVELSGVSNPGVGLKGTAAHLAAPRPAGVAGSRGRLARPPWRGPAAARRVAASLSRKIVRCAQETLHAWAGESRERGCAETRRRRQRRCPPHSGTLLGLSDSTGSHAHHARDARTDSGPHGVGDNRTLPSTPHIPHVVIQLCTADDYAPGEGEWWE
jgi:hypothetical protein